MTPADRPVLASRAWVKALLVLTLLAGLGLRTQDIGPVLAHASERDNPRPQFRDFRDTMYETGHDLRDGENPYDPQPYLARHPGHQELDLYAPQLFVLAVPSSFLPLALAQVLWLALLLASVAVIAWLAWRFARRRPDPWIVAGTSGALFASGPVQQCLETGNISLPLAASAAGALYVGRTRPVLAGTLVAAVLIKPQLGIPLVLLFAIVLGWGRVAAVGAAIAAALAAGPTLVALRAAGSVSEFVDSVSRNLDYSTNIAGDVAHRADVRRSDLWGFIGKVFKVNPTTGTQLLTLVIVCGLAAVVLRRRGALHRPIGDIELVLFLAAFLLAMPHYSYDLPILLIGVIAVGVAVSDRRFETASLAAASAGLCTIPLLHLGSVDTALEKLGIETIVPWIDAAAIIAAFALALSALVLASRTPDWRRT